MNRLCCVVALCLSFVAIDTVSAQVPKLTHLVPAAVAPGQTVDVTVYGTDLTNPTAVWTSLPAGSKVELSKDVAKNGMVKTQVVYKVTTPKDAPVGTYAIRLATGTGASNVRPLVIDDCPTLTMAANTTLATAQELPLPVAVEGACSAESYHYFKFRGEAGQRVAIDVWARRLGSVLDPVVRVLDAQGRDLAFGDDDEATEADSRCAVVLPAAGEYLIELRDIRYQGSAAHRFRMRVGDLPLVSTSFPSAVQKGAITRVTLLGADGEPDQSAEVTVPADSVASYISVAARKPNGKTSTPISVPVSNLVEQVEFEPNDTLETASPLQLTGAINGRFDLAKDRDYFKFDAKKGQRFLMQGKTRSLGVPSDLLLRIVDAKGAQVAEADDVGLDEGTLDFNCSADGAYFLVVEELLGRGGANHIYRVEIAPYAAGFALTLDVDAKTKIEPEPFNPPKGGAFTTKVVATRRGYTGPITLSVEGLPEGAKYTNNVIAEAKNDTLLTVTVPETLEPGKFYPVKIVGKATIDKQEVSAVASTIAHLRAQLNGLSIPPAGLDGTAMVSVGPPAPDFFKIEVAQPAVMPLLTGAASVKLKVTKLNKFDDKITLKLASLPAGFAAKDVTIEKGKVEGVIELTGPANGVEGTIPLQIAASATFNNQPKTIVTEVPLKVVRPLSVAATVAAEGKSPALKVKLERATGVTGEVKLALANLPRGVSAAAVTVAADKNEATVPLKVETNAARGLHNVVVQATIGLKSRPYRADSAPVSVALTK
ncbi:MAG: PPC domain-containing protein [Planctomycetaceae bacterium]|nr:PPC domain-containing protein [Planctomycetaceae bacterium]